MENCFTTYDILLCSFLLTDKEVSLLEVRESFGRRFIFILSPQALCEQLAKDYLNNVQAPARELFANREMLIGEIKRSQR